MSNNRIKDRLRTILRQRGASGIINLQKTFQEFDIDNNGRLSWEEFVLALQKSGLAPSSQDCRLLFLEFDNDNSNDISQEEFLHALRGPLSAKRRNILTRIFDEMDSDGDGIVSMSDIGSCFNPKGHPDVKNGQKTVPAVLREFFDTFESVTSNGYVNLEQFLEYYANASFFEDDTTFSKTMDAIWNTKPASYAASKSSGKSLSDIADGRASHRFNDETVTPEHPLVIKLRNQLKSRGAKGIIGLARKFRIMDDDGSGTITLMEFKKALRELALNINDQDFVALFNYFDNDKSGSIDFDEFLTGVRGEMNERRKNLVGMAFSKLDKDGNGYIDPEDIIDTYDASKHPDVLAGKKTSEEVFREFLDTFDVGGEKDGKVTRNEFQNYYANVSSSIDDDDYFELMIRNAWHISGGEGWCANTANRRVLVTHADGRQTVEEIKDDLGIKADDKASMMRALKAQGINVYDVSPYDSQDINDSAKGTSTLSVLNRYKHKQVDENASRLRAENSTSANSVSSQFSNLGLAAVPFQSPSQILQDNLSGLLPPGTELLVRKLKTEMKSRGVAGFVGLQRRFRIMDDDNSKCLSRYEFNKAMKELRVPLNDSELRILFDHFDADRSGSIDFEEFVQGVRDPLSPRRLLLVNKAFSRLDKDGSGFVDASDIVNTYDASKHPDVIAGKRSQKAILDEFLDTFDVGGEKDGKVTRKEFENYYANLGANIDDDDYFELMIRNAWHISGGEGWCANTANRRVLVTHADGRQTVEEIKDDLGIKADDKASMMRALKAQGIDARNVDFHGGSNESDLSKEEEIARKGAVDVRKLASASVTHQSSPRPSTFTSTAKSRRPQPPDYGLQLIINRLKKEMKSRGSQGFIGMQRKFRIIDDDNSKTISLSEFKKALIEMKLDLTPTEIRMLFEHFDTDQNGTIEYEEFVQGLREPLNERRRLLVNTAFSKLDKNNDNSLTPEDIINMYDSSNHPDVLAGKSTAADVMQEFLDTFDVGGEKDGRVTRREFENYYTNVGASIDDDDYFELMIRNAWHISGGEGWCGNTSNRRVLVTHADGRESVEEIRGDLGIDEDDKAAMMRALRSQGIHASTIEVFNQEDVFDGEQKQHRKKFFNNYVSGQTSAPSGVLPGTGAPSFSKAAAGSPYKNKLRHQKVPEPSIAVKRIIDKIVAEMKSRGATGFTGMQRKFRLMDDDGSKCLDISEFKKTVDEMNISLSDVELRQVFNHFDVDCSGAISYEEFLQGVRKPLSSQRLSVVEEAFQKIDRDKSDVVDAKDIAYWYDASKHPEVIAGRMTADQVYRQFLDTFDVGGEVDGKVTRNEFINYYTNIGASIDNDDYFELMIRNAWQLRGADGSPASGTDRRLLARRLENTSGPSTKESGKQASLNMEPDSTSVVDTTEFPVPEEKVRRKKLVSSRCLQSSAPTGVLPGTAPSSSTNLANIVRTKKADPGRHKATAGTSEAETVRDGSVMKDALAVRTSRNIAKNRPKEPPNYGLSNILRSLKIQLKSRGAHGFIGLQRKFRVMDDDGSKCLSRAEFNKAMKEMRLSLVDSELRMLFEYFDTNESDSIDFEEFIQGIRDPLNERRLSLVTKAFDILDKDGNGYVDAEDLIESYDTSMHPDVLAGKKSANQVLEEFLDTFDVGDDKDGKVTKKEFINYYTNIGANIDNDDYFELMIRNAWHISGGEGWCANTANRRVLVTHADGRQTVEEIKDDLGIKADDKASMMRALKAQGINARNVECFDSDSLKDSAMLHPNEVQEQKYHHRKQGNPFKNTFSIGGGAQEDGGVTNGNHRSNKGQGKKQGEQKHLFQSSIVFGDDGVNEKKSAPQKLHGGIARSRAIYQSALDGAGGGVVEEKVDSNRKVHPSSLSSLSKSQGKPVAKILGELRKEMAARGARGITGLSRRFRAADDSRNGSLCFEEFKKAITECAINLSEQDFQNLFHHFDQDRSGSISFNEFLVTLRGEMNERRKNLVGMAFSKLDKDGNGYIDPEDIIDTYDASKHPDVLAGKKTSEEVFREFLDTFDVGGEKDGKVTRNEFQNYYANVSSSIDDDDYFELMIRNAWHISGGEGWCANTANRRVLVTHADGRQTVEEIKDDLGIKADDKASMMRALKAQGINVRNVNAYHGEDLRKERRPRHTDTFRSQFKIG